MSDLEVNVNISGWGCASLVLLFAAVVTAASAYFWYQGMPVEDAVQVGMSYASILTVSLCCGLPTLLVVLMFGAMGVGAVMERQPRRRGSYDHTSFWDRLLGR